MALEKTNRINALFEFYEPLLTPKQTEYTALYYRDDFSLGEIASEFGVSRQAVYDNIKRTAALLETYEGKLHLYQTFAKQDAQLSALIDYAKQTYPKDHRLASMLADLLSLEDSE